MQEDPVRYFQDLTENYRQMSDGELIELAEKPEDLTDVAQQVLRDEMNKRRLERRQPSVVQPRTDIDSSAHFDLVGGPFTDFHASAPEFEAPEDGEPAPEYSWKTLLRDCQSNDQALQLSAALMRHGIESWVKQFQVYVAADQLGQAQAVAAQPIPQDIIDEWNTALPEFELPGCPRCGSKDDVMLTSADPANAWLCEACGAEWTDPEPASGEDEDTQKSSAP